MGRTANGSRRIHAQPGHRSAPDNCIDHVAIGESGTPLRFDNAIPGDTLATLRFGPKAGREQPLRGVVDGRLTHSLPLQVRYRRLSEESAAVLAKMVEDPAQGGGRRCTLPTIGL